MVKKNRNNTILNRRYVKVIFLDGSSSTIETEVDATMREVFDKACQNIGIVDTNLFGLAVFTADNQPRFLDMDCKIAKQTTKGWRTHNQETDRNEEPAFTVHLQVQYYVEKLSSIRDSNARNYYYRQLKSNFIDYPIMYPDDRCFLLAAYSMIAEEHDSSTFDPRAFFPAWVIDKHKSKYIKEHLPSLRHKFPNLTKYDAQNLVATALCHETPIGYNMHLYRMSKELNAKQSLAEVRNCSSKHCKSQSTGQCLQCTALYIGIGPNGIEIFEVGNGGFIQSLTQLAWKQIKKIDYSKRKLELVSEGITSILYSPTEDLSRHVWTICRQCHARYLSTEKAQLRRSINRSFRDKYRESYIDSEYLEDEWNHEKGEDSLLTAAEFTRRQAAAGELYKKDRQNRHSIISDAASSSTSGIVSDRTCFSYYDSQEELLNGNKTITSSQDSLLEPSESKSRPVQRATSEPSKKFEQLRELKVRQQHPTLMSRAASDDTVRSSQKVTDHIYENISEVRNRLIVAAQAKPSKLSPRVVLDPIFSFNKPQTTHDQYKLQAQRQGALHYSMGQLNQLSSNHTPAAFRSQYNIVKPSASMEQLLQDYQPPPSYNEKHKRVGERMLAAMSQEKISESHEPGMLMPSKACSNETVNQKQQGTSRLNECSCRTASYPEMDKLKNMSDLPMISALVKDTNLHTPTATCNHCNNNNQLHSPIDRPFSWHSETFMLPNSLPTVSSAQDSY